MFWRVMAAVAFDTIAHRDAVAADINSHGGSTTPFTHEGAPALRMDVALGTQAAARALRNRLRTAVGNGWITGGKFHVHQCTADEPAANWRDCKTQSYEEN